MGEALPPEGTQHQAPSTEHQAHSSSSSNSNSAVLDETGEPTQLPNGSRRERCGFYARPRYVPPFPLPLQGEGRGVENRATAAAAAVAVCLVLDAGCLVLGARAWCWVLGAAPARCLGARCCCCLGARCCVLGARAAPSTKHPAPSTKHTAAAAAATATARFSTRTGEPTQLPNGSRRERGGFYARPRCVPPSPLPLGKFSTGGGEWRW